MANKCFIYETLSSVNSLKKERTADGLVRLTGTFGVCDVVNNNKRKYVKENYSEMVKRLQKKINEEGCPGELEHPNSMNIDYNNVSHKVESIGINENGVVSGTITLLNTPKGKIAQAIIEGGLPLFVSSRAQGSVDRNGTVTLEDLKTYDLVGTPGFSQAKLHLNEGQVVESINESCFIIEQTSEKNQDNEMTNEEFEAKYNSLLERVDILEYELKKRPTAKQVTEGVERWVKEEYTQEIDNWITETVLPTIKNDLISQISEGTEKWMHNEVCNFIENWVINEFAPEIEKWVTEEYSDGIEKWVTEEYSDGIQNWVVEHFSPEIQNWVVEHFAPEIDNWVTSKIEESVNEGFKSDRDDLAEVDSILEAISNADAKPKYSRKQILNEAKEEFESEPRFIQSMPADKKAQWDMASEDVKESIKRRARLYNLVNEAAIENFWNNIDFSKVKPIETVLEGFNDIQDEWERNIRARLHRNI